MMSFFFKALMAYSFPVALYRASSTWKTTEKLYFKQFHIFLSDYFNSNWCQLFPSTPDNHLQNQTQGNSNNEGCQCKFCPSPKQHHHSWPSASGAPQSSHRGSFAKFWEWSSSTSDPHERNGNGVPWFSTLRTAFSRLWSHKSSWILIVNNSYQLLMWLGWVCCSISALQQISPVLQCFYSDLQAEPHCHSHCPPPQWTSLLPSQSGHGPTWQCSENPPAELSFSCRKTEERQYSRDAWADIRVCVCVRERSSV